MTSEDVPDARVGRRIGGRSMTPDGVLGADADCEAQLDYVLALYLGRDDFSSIVIEDELLDRLSHDKKLKVLRKLLARHGVGHPPFDTLASELKALREFRNHLAHAVASEDDPLHRIRRRAAQNEVEILTEPQVAEQVDRGMRCLSALSFLFDLRTRPVEAQQDGGGPTDFRGRP